MDLGDLIKPEGVIALLKAKSKKQVLHDLAHKAAEVAKVIRALREPG